MTAVADTWPQNLDQACKTQPTGQLHCLPNVYLSAKMESYCFTSSYTFAPMLKMEGKFFSKVVTSIATGGSYI